MTKSLKSLAFKVLSTENYLRLLQRGYFFSYRMGLLKNNPDYAYHYFVKNLIDKGDTVLDIGANLGYYSKLFSQWVGAKGSVYSVEPIKLYNKIFNEATKSSRNIILLPYALGLEEKKIQMVSTTSTGYLNTGLPHVYDAESDGEIDAQDFSFDAEMKIPAKLFADIDRIDYIKCDIEGFEDVVIVNMKDIIAKHLPFIQIELWGKNETVVSELLHSLGYKAYRYSASEQKLSSDSDLIKNGKGDFIFVHRDNAKHQEFIL
ncbi:hypothetical protein AwDysgo_04300 [Bacteroidales bacterium]|nr:hypothetical protein AwDysgo_04300 [Bacteroidales bacterium]